MAKTVYVVEVGEKYEGGSVEGVYSSLAKAIEVAMKVETVFDGGWMPDKRNELYWVNGCDYVKIIAFEVQK